MMSLLKLGTAVVALLGVAAFLAIDTARSTPLSASSSTC